MVSKIKLLLDMVDNMRTLADSIQAVAQAIQSDSPDQSSDQKPKSTDLNPIVKAVSLEQVRAVLAEKSQAGFTAEVRGLLEKYGAPKLSQIDQMKYADLLADAEALR